MKNEDGGRVIPEHFFVYVVESPSARDLYVQRTESSLLQQAANLNAIPCVARYAISGETFRVALQSGLAQAMQLWPERMPVLHISCHGDSEGIGLSSGERLLWRDLRQLLHPINRALSGALLVSMSSCGGFSGQRMAMHLEDQDLPFFALVGNSKDPRWSETAVAFAAFDHHLARGSSLNECVAAMKAASGNPDFSIITAALARAGYKAHVAKVNLEKAQAVLREAQAAVQSPTESSTPSRDVPPNHSLQRTAPACFHVQRPLGKALPHGTAAERAE